MVHYNKIQHLRGTTAEWAADDIVIPEGEMAFELLTGLAPREKVGDGTSKWSELPYLMSDWKLLTIIEADGTDNEYVIEEDNNGLNFKYSNIKIIFISEGIAEAGTTYFYLNEALTKFCSQANLPDSSNKIWSFEINSTLNRYKVGFDSAALYEKNITTPDGEAFIIDYIKIISEEGYNYPSGSTIKIYGK